MSAMGIDEAKLEQFMGRAVMDMGAAMSAPRMVLGTKLGLYKAMAGAGRLTSAEVAERAGCDERDGDPVQHDSRGAPVGCAGR